MTAFIIGYESFKSGKSGVPSMNNDLQNFMHTTGLWASNNHDVIMSTMGDFKKGWQKAEQEWEEEFFANDK
ncbi:MAG: hypothetical protein ACRC8W_16905 [Plesiomonas shigelloides]